MKVLAQIWQTISNFLLICAIEMVLYYDMMHLES
jgi:hypothetical protein